MLAAANALNYRINPIARALLTGRTNAIGLLLADITNPMFFDEVRGAEHVTARHGYTLLLAESQESSDIELEVAERLLPSVDGFILATSRLQDEQIRDLATRKELVLINRRIGGVEDVTPDLALGITEALTLVRDTGHSMLAYLSGPTRSWMSGARWRTIVKQSRVVGVRPVRIGPGLPTLDGGRASLGPVLASGATAVIAYNDLMAIGLLRAAQESDIAVPGKLSIIGFDDIFGSDFTSPAITTIRIPHQRLGEIAAGRLLGRIKTALDDAEASPEFPATMLIRRGTVGPNQ